MICESLELPRHNILTNNYVFFLPLKKQELVILLIFVTGKKNSPFRSVIL